MENKKAHSAEFLGEARDYWWNEDYVELLAKRLNLKQCNTLVDMGCGKGYMAYKLAPYLNRNAQVYGFDLEQSWIDEARARQANVSNHNMVQYLFQVGDARNIPLASSLADVTVCQTLLIHVANPKSVLGEMKRITRDGGWLVAIEPNNAVNALVADSLPEEDIERRIELVEAQLRIERGKQVLGEGYNSVGDLVPQMFAEMGLSDLQVWLVDKPLYIIPPYDTREKQLRVQETLNWIELEEVYLDYKGQLRYYLNGGGTEEKFQHYWTINQAKMKQLKAALETEAYTSAGGGLMYIVAGRK